MKKVEDTSGRGRMICIEVSRSLMNFYLLSFRSQMITITLLLRILPSRRIFNPCLI